MTPDLSKCRKVVGIKQTTRALREHRVERLYIANDADPMVLGPIAVLSGEEGVEAVCEETMVQLGRHAGIAVGAAVIAVLKE